MNFLIRELLTLSLFVFVANPILYKLFDFILIRFNQPFQELAYDKRRYVVKNLSKSLFLCFLSITALPLLLGILRTGVWPNREMRILGHIYVATDIAGLIFVPNLPMTTILHHSVVTFCALLNILVDYRQPGIHRAMMTLAYFSMVPYLVNTLLGMRHLGFPSVKRRLSQISSIVYGISIICNFGCQHYYILISNNNLVIRILYMILYWVILHDDLVLMNYLIFSGFDMDFSVYILSLVDKLKNNLGRFRLFLRSTLGRRKILESECLGPINQTT